MSTKTYASILWIYGLFLDSVSQCKEAIKYLEDAMRYFENIECRDIEYYQCISKLATLYLDEYDKSGNIEYLDRARPIGQNLYDSRDAYRIDRNTRYAATEVNRRLKTMK